MMQIFLQAQSMNEAFDSSNIDSLVFYDQFDLAEKAILKQNDSIGKQSKTRSFRKTILKNDLHLAYIDARNLKLGKALTLALTIEEKAQKYELHELQFKACLLIENIYEHNSSFQLCKNYLEKAFEINRLYKLDSFYSEYFIRAASYYRLTNNKDSALRYAKEGLRLAQQYNNKREIIDGNLLLGILNSKTNVKEAVFYYSNAIRGYVDKREYSTAVAMYDNISLAYIKNKQLDSALKYSDSSILFSNKNGVTINSYTYRIRHGIFKSIGNIDSAYNNLKLYQELLEKESLQNEQIEIKKVTEKYNLEKSQALIKSKNQQIFFIVSLLLILGIGSIILYRKNKKIQTQNILISRQMETMTKEIEHKQVLLSELQHRVKNNLQHVISILEIQKESIGFNTIDELVRESQNRVLSMALIHKKLNISEHVNEVDFKKYLAELADLVANSYDINRKKISLIITCEVEKISIEKAMPIGLILVELISNSIKYAFQDKKTGIITIAFSKEEASQKLQLYYADNGIGYDFDIQAENGLGLSIIKGLIDQLDAVVKTDYKNGFELILTFK